MDQDVPSSQDIDAFPYQEAPHAGHLGFFGHWRGMINSILAHMLELSLQPSSSWEFDPLTTAWHVWLDLSGMANLP